MPRLANLMGVASKYKFICIRNKFFYSSAVLLTVLSPLVTGCSTGGSQTALSPSTQSLAANNPKPVSEQVTPQASPQASSSPQPDPYPEASSKAIGAATISKSAQSPDDWKLVAQMWQEAIALMKSVPTTSSNHAPAQKKVVEYQKNLAYASKQALLPVVQTVATTQSVTQQVYEAGASSPSKPSVPVVTTKPQVSATVTPTKNRTVIPKPKQLTIEDKERVLEASVKGFMDDYFDQTVTKGRRGDIYSCAKTFELSSSLYSPENVKILETSVAPDASMAWVRARIESSTNLGRPIRKNWKFILVKGDTYVEKQMLDNGSKEGYKYSKSKYGGWCVQLLTED